MDLPAKRTGDAPAGSGAGRDRRPLQSWLDAIRQARTAARAELAVFEAERAGDLSATGQQRRRPDLETLRRLYLDERLTARQIAEQLGLTEAQVASRLRRGGIRRQRTPQTITDEKVRVFYEQGLTIRAIAVELGLHQRSVWRHLDQAGVQRRARGQAGVALSRRQLERLYVEERLSLAEVGRRFDVDPHVVARNLDRYGIPRARPPIDRAALQELYVREQLGIRVIAGRLGVSQGEVRAGLARHGIPIRRPGRPGTG